MGPPANCVASASAMVAGGRQAWRRLLFIFALLVACCGGEAEIAELGPTPTISTQHDKLLGEAGGRRGGSIMTSGSFMMAVTSNTAGNDEEDDAEDVDSSKMLGDSARSDAYRKLGEAAESEG